MSVYNYSEECGPTGDQSDPEEPIVGGSAGMDDGTPLPRANYRGFLPDDVRNNLRTLQRSGAGSRQMQTRHHGRANSSPLLWLAVGIGVIWWINKR